METHILVMKMVELQGPRGMRKLIPRIRRIVKNLVEGSICKHRATQVRVQFSTRLYSTQGRCYPQKNLIRLNRAYVQLNRNNDQVLWSLIVHEVAHLIDPTHGEQFRGFLQDHGVEYEGKYSNGRGKELPPVSWTFCLLCGKIHKVYSKKLDWRESFLAQHFKCSICKIRSLKYKEMTEKRLERWNKKLRVMRGS